MYGLAHSIPLDSMYNLSRWLAELGRQEATADVARQALSARLREQRAAAHGAGLSTRPQWTSTRLSSAAGLLAELGQHEDAEMARQLSTAQQRMLGSDELASLDSMTDLSDRLAE